MADVFVSYSRRDAEFVNGLVADLEACGKSVWIDVDGLEVGVVFPEAIRTAIEASGAFVFVITPASAASSYCEQEVDHALALNKRVVPVLRAPVADDELPEPIKVRNWVHWTPENDAKAASEKLVQALNTDLDHVHAHTHWLVKALDWESHGRDHSFLLRGSELAAAESWLAGAALTADPAPNPLQREFLLAGRRAVARRQWMLVAASVVVAVVSVALLIFALISRGEAVRAETTARSQALAADSEAQLSIDPELAVLLGIRAVQTAPTPQAMFALRAALDASPIRWRLPVVRTPSCVLPGENTSLGVGPAAPGFALSPDGSQIAEGVCSGVVRIADARDGHVLRQFRVPGAAMLLVYASSRALVIDVGGRRLLAVDPASGRVLVHGPRLLGVAPPVLDSRAPVVALAEEADLALWNLRTGSLRRLPLPHTVNSQPVRVAFSPDGQRVAVAEYARIAPAPPGVVLLDVANGRLLASTGSRMQQGSPALVGSGVTFSPHGRSLAVAESDDHDLTGTIVLLDARTLRLERTLRTDRQISASDVAFSPDGTRLAYLFADGTGGVMSPSGDQVVSFPVVKSAPSRVAFSLDGQLVVESSQNGNVRAWQASPRAYSTTLSSIDGFEEGEPDEDGFVTLGLAGATVDVRRWRADGKGAAPPLVIAPGSIASIADAFLSPDGQLAAFQPADPHDLSRPEPMTIWSTSQRRVIRTLPLVIPQSLESAFFGSPVFTPDDSTIASDFAAPHGRTAYGLVSVHTGRQQTLFTDACGPPLIAGAIATSRTGRLIAFATECGLVRVWDRARNQWAGPPLNMRESLFGIAISPDSRQVAVASQSGTVSVFDIATGKVIATLSRNIGAVYGVAYSKNGRYLAAAGQDSTIRIWDAQTWNELRVIPQPAPVGQTWFSPDSRSVYASAFNGTAVWQYDACTACENPRELLAIARTRVTRWLTPQERQEFAVG